MQGNRGLERSTTNSRISPSLGCLEETTCVLSRNSYGPDTALYKNLNCLCLYLGLWRMIMRYNHHGTNCEHTVGFIESNTASVSTPSTSRDVRSPHCDICLGRANIGCHAHARTHSHARCTHTHTDERTHTHTRVHTFKRTHTTTHIKWQTFN